MKKFGFVSISGQPNVGKSTILNGLLQEKLAIISDKPETTRDNIKGILTEKNSQIIFTDTPGIHKPHNLLGKVMISRAQSSMLESDIILFITEKHFAFNESDMRIIHYLPEDKKDQKVILVINKVDKVKDKKQLLPLMQQAQKTYPFDEIVPISALKQKDLDSLLTVIKKHLPEGPFHYPEDQLTDKSNSFHIQEIIREKILTTTYEEIPHSVAITIDEMYENKKDQKTEISATIHVERTSQKSIIIGKSGAMIKKIGELARKDIQALLEKHVYLTLWVKVSEKWKKSPSALRDMGYVD